MNNVLDWAKPHQRFFEEMTRIAMAQKMNRNTVIS